MNQSDIENKINELEERISKLEQNGSIDENIDSPKDSNNTLRSKIAEKIDSIPTTKIVIISLHIKPKQSTQSIQQSIKEFGWAENTFFEKGDFSKKLLKKGLVHKVDKDSKNKDVFSLTGKGEVSAKAIIKKYQLS